MYLWWCLAEARCICEVSGERLMYLISGSMLVYLWCMVVYWCRLVCQVEGGYNYVMSG